MSQSHSGNYMDGVPVKISEKYKPPPLITLPYGVVERATASLELVQSVDYDFSLEKNVLKRLTEWRNARETLRNERNHRLQLKEEARQRELDQIAASETEERLKQLSVSEVSYPSTEEISEISPDDGEAGGVDPAASTNVTDVATQNNCQITNSASETFTGNASDTAMYQYGSNIYPSNRYLDNTKCEHPSNILQPIPVSPNRICIPQNLLDDPDPIKQFHQNMLNKSQWRSSSVRPAFIKNNIENLTFSDFENDTSSPFDNLELKTINDLELLAQVLNSQQCSVNQARAGEDNSIREQQTSRPESGQAAQTYSELHSMQAGSDSYSPLTVYNSHPSAISDPGQPYAHGCVPMTNGYYDSGSNKLVSYPAATSLDQMNGYYAPGYTYSALNSTYQHIPSMNNYNLSNSDGSSFSNPGEHHMNADSDNYQRDTKSSYSQATNVPYSESYGMHYSMYPNTQYQYYAQPSFIQDLKLKLDGADSQALIKSRSRSVPDIVKELDDEVAEARLKAKERSHNCSPAPQSSVPRPAAGPPAESLHDPYHTLPPPLQAMCVHISGMGFPLDRVARACDLMGKDDKKIIEYLLNMGQLMDLGFPESKVGKALLQHNCNSDKALDELIS